MTSSWSSDPASVTAASGEQEGHRSDWEPAAHARTVMQRPIGEWRHEYVAMRPAPVLRRG